MSRPSAIIGIDNGLKGGICALCPDSGDILGYRAMPVDSSGSRGEPDTQALVDWLSSFWCMQIGIEEPPYHAPSSDSMRSMSISYGLCVGTLRTRGLRVLPVAVRDWHRKMLGKIPQGQTKPFALRAAKERWPGQTWLATPRSRVPHDGIVDAALIAEFLRIGGGIKNN